MINFAFNLRYLLESLGRMALIAWAVFAVIICATEGTLWPFAVTIDGGTALALGATFIGMPIFLFAGFWIWSTLVQSLICPID